MFISVVIPTYNRLPILQMCLRALEAQRLEAPLTGFEVVLVDDGSTDETVAWLTTKAAELPHVRLIQQSHGGPAQGRNRGVENARGEVIVFIDSDLVVTPHLLELPWQGAGALLAAGRPSPLLHLRGGDQYGQFFRPHQRTPQAPRPLLGLLRHRQCGDRPRPACRGGSV